MSFNVIFVVKIYFGQFFMPKNMVLTHLIYFGVILRKILVAIATDKLKMPIFGNCGYHGNQIEHKHHENSTQKI